MPVEVVRLADSSMSLKAQPIDMPHGGWCKPPARPVVMIGVQHSKFTSKANIFMGSRLSAASFLIFLIVNNDKLDLDFLYKLCCLLNKIHSSFFVVNQLCADSSRLAISFATVSYVSGLHFLILMPIGFLVSSDIATIPLLLAVD